MASPVVPLALALHGGSGTIRRENLDQALEREHREALRHAQQAGWEQLVAGASALEAVEAAVVSLEDCPLFNAGRGSVYTAEETQEMDASVMTGHNLAAGAVASVQCIRNPVSLARRVMEQGEFVLLSGAGAEEFARTQGMTATPPDWFHSEQRLAELQQARSSNSTVLDHDGQNKFGTVGAVALDAHGNLAAATSTGGLTNKRFGRIGDTPLPGAGTYANNASCAVSCTGYGEYFIRRVAAYDVAARMIYRQDSLDTAAHHVIEELAASNGLGGLVAVNRNGEVALPFNTLGMYRAWKTNRDEGIAIFRED